MLPATLQGISFPLYSRAYYPNQVDWTIQLIVINSKLSGANSFQAMEFCFGKPGLVAISVLFSRLFVRNGVDNHSRLLNGLCTLYETHQSWILY
jgi:hypothetical protein